MYHIIINPASSTGNGRKIWNRIEKILAEQNTEYTPHFTDGPDSARRIAAALTEGDEHQYIIVLGGDGTINEVLTGIRDFGHVTFGYIPAGSSNDFARDLRLTASPEDMIRSILNPKQFIRLDIGCLEYEGTRRNFGVSMGIGYDAAICHEALASRIKYYLNKVGLGKLIYVIIALKQLLATKCHSCDVILDDTQRLHFDDYLFVTSMVHKFEGGGFMFCPKADPSDGLLDICAIDHIGKLKALRMLPTAYKGNHIRFKGVHIYQAKKVQIITDVPAAVHADGESCRLQKEVTVSIDPKQLKMILR
ncbi:MAG: diacylglycerol kinase family lipid kinase [bacterium]|nr:diacylglycerol kinase family lipid kinase [bacterium]